MNKFVKGLLVCMAAILTFFVVLIIIMRPITVEIPAGGRAKVTPDVPFALAGWVNVTHATDHIDFDGLFFARNQSLTIPVSVSGNYQVVLRYEPVRPNMNRYLFEAVIGDQSIITEIQPVWMDETPYYFTDTFGNEFMPPQINVMAVIDDFLRVHGSINKLPTVFEITPGDTLYLTTWGKKSYCTVFYLSHMYNRQLLRNI